MYKQFISPESVIEYRKDYTKLVQLILVCPTSLQIRILLNIFDRFIDRRVG